MKLSLWLPMLAMCQLSACTKHSPAFTEEDVAKRVVPGIERGDIIKQFGRPIYTRKNPQLEKGSTNDVDEILFFETPLPKPLTNEAWAFAGFQVWLKDGKAVKWVASHRDVKLGQ